MYEIKIVTGGKFPNTEYDEENVLRHQTESKALGDATTLGRTSDIFDPTGKIIARVHIDGGIDHY